MSVVKDMSENMVADQIIDLFKEKTVVQVKDHLMTIRHELDEVNVKFGKQLETHYTDLLKVTEEVKYLFDDVKDTDKEFRELCFDDSTYQFKKLPDITINQTTSREDLNLSPITESNATSSTNVLLEVSNWSLAITNFLSRYTDSSTSVQSVKLYDDLKKHFELIETHLHDFKSYDSLIEHKCILLIDSVVEYTQSSRIRLSLIQCIEFFNLFNNGKFKWTDKNVKEFEKIVFDTVLSQDIESLLTSKIDVVHDFVKTDNFKNTLLKRILVDVETNFKTFEELISPNFKDEELNIDIEDDNIRECINISSMNAMGLTDYRKIQIHKIVDILISMIQQLQRYGCERRHVNDIRNRLIHLLQELFPTEANADDEKVNDDFVKNKKTSADIKLMKDNESKEVTVIEDDLAPKESNVIENEQDKSDNGEQIKPFDTNDIVNSIMANYNKANLTKLIQTQIETVKSIDLDTKPIL